MAAVNGNGLKWIWAAVFSLVAVVLATGGALYAHEGRIARTETQCEAIQAWLGRVEGKLDRVLEEP